MGRARNVESKSEKTPFIARMRRKTTEVQHEGEVEKGRITSQNAKELIGRAKLRVDAAANAGRNMTFLHVAEFDTKPAWVDPTVDNVRRELEKEGFNVVVEEHKSQGFSANSVNLKISW